MEGTGRPTWPKPVDGGASRRGRVAEDTGNQRARLSGGWRPTSWDQPREGRGLATGKLSGESLQRWWSDAEESAERGREKCSERRWRQRDVD